MKTETKIALFDAWNYCDREDKSTEFMFQYMSDTANVSYDTVVDFIMKQGDERLQYNEGYKTEELKKAFLYALIEEYYPQGDGYDVYRTKKGSWAISYSNDYPLQHGKGESFVLPDRMVEILMNQKKID